MWIKITEQLPQLSESVLISTHQGNISTGYLVHRTAGIWYLHDQELTGEHPIAWQPLPKKFEYPNTSKTPSDAQIPPLTCEEIKQAEKELVDNAWQEVIETTKQIIVDNLDPQTLLVEIADAIGHEIADYFLEYGKGSLDDLVPEAVRKCLAEQEFHITFRKDHREK